MGITATDIELLDEALEMKKNIKSVLELGSQNLYLSNDLKPPFASTWYESRGLLYRCIDLAGDNNALQLDLSYPIEDRIGQFDLVTDFGTSEHVVQMEKHVSVAFHEGHINSIYPDGVKDAMRGLYHCWLNKHTLLKTGGVMINVNPRTGHWPGHGYHYYTTAFYAELVKIAGYKIHELCEQAAMGNWKSGVNVCAILEKTDDRFPSFEDFCRLDVRQN